MNYLNKMHVGDIVISTVGNIGYVSHIYRDNDTFNWIKVYDRNGDFCPVTIDSVEAEEIPRWFTQIGITKVVPDSLTTKCADCNRDYDTDDRLDTLNSNLLTLIEKLDQIIKED